MSTSAFVVRWHFRCLGKPRPPEVPCCYQPQDAALIRALSRRADVILMRGQSIYRGPRFPEEIISQCVWLYFNLSVSLREVELMMAYRGIQLSYETIRIKVVTKFHG